MSRHKRQRPGAVVETKVDDYGYVVTEEKQVLDDKGQVIGVEEVPVTRTRLNRAARRQLAAKQRKAQ